nr:MAG: hypothetical protein [Bacteriophage sp.]
MAAWKDRHSESIKTIKNLAIISRLIALPIMTFQIIDKDTNKAINLSKFDEDYCAFNGIRVDNFNYAYWFYALERAFFIYGDLADNATGKLHLRNMITSFRKMSMHQAVQMLTIYSAKTFYDNENYEDWEKSLEWLKPVVKFFLSVKDKYYFTFCF